MDDELEMIGEEANRGLTEVYPDVRTAGVLGDIRTEHLYSL
jgi:hypothetical protein